MRNIVAIGQLAIGSVLLLYALLGIVLLMIVPIHNPIEPIYRCASITAHATAAIACFLLYNITRKL